MSYFNNECFLLRKILSAILNLLCINKKNLLLKLSNVESGSYLYGSPLSISYGLGYLELSLHSALFNIFLAKTRLA